MSVHSLSPGNQARDPATPLVRLDGRRRFQLIEGFGGALTQSCVANIEKLSADERHELIEQAFSPERGALSYLRVPVGATDFSTTNYTYADDAKLGLAGFSISHDQPTLDLLKEILVVNPRLQIMLSVWSPPRWMKDNDRYDAGHIKPQDLDLYAQYFVKTILAYEANGLKVHAMTVLNEPHFPEPISMWNSTQMTPQGEEDFVINHLRPALRAAGLSPLVYVNDHNFEYAPDYVTILKSASMRASIAGLAFHCYYGTLAQATALQTEFPGIQLLNTECTATLGNHDADDFAWWIDNQAVASQNAGFSGSVGWNFCLDQNGRPINRDQSWIPLLGLNVDKICKDCRGMVTIDQASTPPKLVFNPEYQALSLMARAEDPGAYRIRAEISGPDWIDATAAMNPDGSYGVVIENKGSAPENVQVQDESCQTIHVSIAARGAVSLRW